MCSIKTFQAGLVNYYSAHWYITRNTIWYYFYNEVIFSNNGMHIKFYFIFMYILLHKNPADNYYYDTCWPFFL